MVMRHELGYLILRWCDTFTLLAMLMMSHFLNLLSYYNDFGLNLKYD